MSRFSLVSPSANVTSFKSQHNNTSQSGWRSERVSDKQVKSMALDPLQSNMDWIGLDWLAGTGVATILRIVHRPKPFLKFPVYRLITLFWIGKVPLLLCQLVKRTYAYSQYFLVQIASLSRCCVFSLSINVHSVNKKGTMSGFRNLIISFSIAWLWNKESEKSTNQSYSHVGKRDLCQEMCCWVKNKKEK